MMTCVEVESLTWGFIFKVSVFFLTRISSKTAFKNPAPIGVASEPEGSLLSGCHCTPMKNGWLVVSECLIASVNPSGAIAHASKLSARREMPW